MSKRITVQDLVLSGWRGVYTGGKQFWAHPEVWPNLVRFGFAAKLEKARRELRRLADNRLIVAVTKE